MHPSQTRLQRILWRNNLFANVDTYELTTVTYGTASASSWLPDALSIWLVE